MLVYSLIIDLGAHVFATRLAHMTLYIKQLLGTNVYKVYVTYSFLRVK